MSGAKTRQSCRFIAFYSYKGGVGRTLALVNTARVLAARGKRVVVVDLDLGAPGLQDFQALWPKGAKTHRPRQQGFVEYLNVCRHDEPPASLASYVHPCRGRPGDKGRLWIMPAGLHGESHYLEIINGINWERFYQDEDGFQILENLRGHIVDELQPDYVLMDARPGLSETGVIATHQLADMVVLVFNLNRQNLEGAKRIHDSLRRLPSPPLILLVASPIPAVPVDKGTPFFKKMEWIRQHFDGAENTQRPLIIPYQATLAFGEYVLVDHRDDPFSSDEAYRRLVSELQRVVGVDPDVFLDEAAHYWREGRLDEAEKALLKGLEQNPDHTGLLDQCARLQFASSLVKGEMLGPAIDELRRSLQTSRCHHKE